MKLVSESVKSFAMAKTFNENAAKLNTLTFSQDGENCLASSDDDSITIYRTRDGTKAKTVYSKKYGVENARFTKRPHQCIYSSNKVNDDIRHQEIEQIKYIKYFSGHKDRVVCLEMCPGQEEMFLSGSRDRTIRLWDLRSPLCQGLMKTNGTPIGAFDPAGLIFAAGIDNSTIRLFDIRTFDKGPFVSWHIPKTSNAVWTNLEFSADGTQVLFNFLLFFFTFVFFEILITTSGETLKIIDAYKGDLIGEARCPNGNMTKACYSPDGSMIVAGDDNGTVTLYDNKGHTLSRMDGRHPQAISAIAFNPRYMMMTTACHQICLWLPTLEE